MKLNAVSATRAQSGWGASCKGLDKQLPHSCAVGTVANGAVVSVDQATLAAASDEDAPSVDSDAFPTPASRPVYETLGIAMIAGVRTYGVRGLAHRTHRSGREE